MQTLGETIAPARCLRCLREGTWLCQACQAEYEAPPLVCISCKKIRPRGLTCMPCRHKNVLTGCVSAGTYQSEMIQRGVHWLKFRSIRQLAPTLAYLLLPRLIHIGSFEHLPQTSLLVPIPLHKSRLRERGFNQAEDIARELASLSGIPALNALSRSRATLTQTQLDADMRRTNMIDAFTLTATLPPHIKTAIVLDDVTTTGSTLSEAAKVLKAAGIQEVWGATIARG